MSEMSREYWIDLGRRWVAAGCGWAPGVLDMEGWRVGGWTLHDGAREAMKAGQHRLYHYPKIPDLRDPPTVGALLAEVREAWGDPEIGVLVNSAGRWDVIRRGLDIRFPIKGWTEAEALVKALESAPRKEG